MSAKTAFWYGAAILLLLCRAAAAQAQAVATVAVEGNQRVETGTVLLQLSTKTGEPFSKDKVDADVKQIYRTGYFDQVIARTDPNGAKVNVVFEVTEKPAIRSVMLEGNKEVSDDTLKEKLNIGARRFLDRSKIRASIEQAKQYYYGLGYYDAAIEAKETPAEENQVDLTFVISEGEKKVIREVVFEGNKAISTSDLEDAIKTKTYFWLTSWATSAGILKKELLLQDQKDLVHYYLNRGYVDARVNEPEVTEIPRGLRVTFKIHEGDVYSVSKVSASGTLYEDDAAKTLEGVEVKEGEVFNADQIRKDTFSVSEKFTDKGYAFANVSPDTEIDREKKTIGLNFQIDKGKLITIDRINITGNKKTLDNVVRRSLTLHEQELFSSSKLRRSQELLQRLGYFDEVTITPEPTSLPDKVDLNVAVREGNTGTFGLGAGISSGEGFIFNGNIAEHNVFGSGNSLSLDANTGTETNNYVLSFVNPRVNDTYMSFGADALAFHREFDDFNRGQAGGGITFGYPLWFLGESAMDDYRATLNYQFTQINISDVSTTAAQLIKDQEGVTNASEITPRVVRNTINNPLDPTGGSRQSASFDIAGLGGNQKFWLAEASTTHYFDLWDSPIGTFVLSPRMRIGYGKTYDGGEFPLFKRYFEGGINSVRGYTSRHLGPQDAEGSYYGGSKAFVTNVDFLFPLVNSIGLKGLIFYDAGNAFDNDQGIAVRDLRQAIGWGFRWKSPIAPIRIEIGYPIAKQPGERAVVTNFSFGAPQ